MEVLLRNDALTNVADCKGCYPLHLAAWKGDADIVKLLIHQGPSHTKVNEQVCLFFLYIIESLPSDGDVLLQMTPGPSQTSSNGYKFLLANGTGRALPKVYLKYPWF